MQFRNIPSVDSVMGSQSLADLVSLYRRDWMVGLVRQALEQARGQVRLGSPAPLLEDVAEIVRRAVDDVVRPSPQPVINATGVIVHTNLGRAPLSRAATEAATAAALGYSDLEIDLDTGRRGSRQAQLQGVLRQLTGAEAALVVNNNASALLLGLSALAVGKEVVVSRGEAVEIGGGFRIPDVLRQSGAVLVDVGTTNRTYAWDYEDAMTDNTGAFLKAHASNFRVEGFTAEVGAQELVELGRQQGVPVLHDVGSGALLETEKYGLAHEPTTPGEYCRRGGPGLLLGGQALGRASGRNRGRPA